MVLNLQPATPERFAGRKKEIDIFQELLKSEKDSLFIYGEAGIGKSSLLEKYKSMIDKKHLVVYVAPYGGNISVVENLLFQLEHEIDEVRSFWDKSFFIKIQNRISELLNSIRAIQDFIPSIQPTPSLFVPFRIEQVYDNIIEIFIDLSRQLKDKKLFFFLDDFQNISTEERDKIMHILKNREKNVHFIITWRETNEPKSFDYERYAISVPIVEMSIEEYREIVKKEKEILVDGEGIEYAHRVLKGHPYYLISLLIYCKNNNKKLSKENIDEILPKGIESIDNLHEDIYSRLTEYYETLKAASILRKSFGVEILFFMLEKKDKEKDRIEEGLTELENRKIFLKSENFSFAHSLFKDYITRKVIMTEEKKSLHLKASEFYRQKHTAENILEAYFHLQNAGEKEKAIKYVLENMVFFQRQGWWEEVVELLTSAIKKFRDIGLSMEIFEQLGIMEGLLGDWWKAIEHHKKALQIAKESKNTEMMGIINNNLGAIMEDRENWEEAKKYYMKSLEIYEKMGYIYEGAKIMGNIVSIMIKGDELEEAEEYCKKIIKMFEEINDPDGMAMSYERMGTIKMQENKWKAAEKYYRKSMEIHEKRGDLYGAAIIKANIGILKITQKKYDEAFNIFVEVIDIFFKLGAEPNVKMALGYITRIAFTFKKLGNEAKNKGEKEKSLEYFKMAKEIFDPFNKSPRIQEELEKINSEIEEIEKQL